ncbi:MAG: hypothetical protein M1821_006286 [Bathelium mastoideum]|nr:MAG: hypothetical protein M1821_006286 [Bathelium mastoideum]
MSWPSVDPTPVADPMPHTFHPPTPGSTLPRGPSQTVNPSIDPKNPDPGQTLALGSAQASESPHGDESSVGDPASSYQAPSPNKPPPYMSPPSEDPLPSDEPPPLPTGHNQNNPHPNSVTAFPSLSPTTQASTDSDPHPSSNPVDPSKQITPILHPGRTGASDTPDQPAPNAGSQSGQWFPRPEGPILSILGQASHSEILAQLSDPSIGSVPEQDHSDLPTGTTYSNRYSSSPDSSSADPVHPYRIDHPPYSVDSSGNLVFQSHTLASGSFATIAGQKLVFSSRNAILNGQTLKLDPSADTSSAAPEASIIGDADPKTALASGNPPGNPSWEDSRTGATFGAVTEAIVMIDGAPMTVLEEPDASGKGEVAVMCQETLTLGGDATTTDDETISAGVKDLAALGRALVSPLRPADSPSTIYKDITFAKLRRFHTLTTSAQEQWLFPSTATTYAQIAHDLDFPPVTTELPNLDSAGAKAHWYGPRNAAKLLVFFPGGGYNLPCSAGHFRWAIALTRSLQDEGHSVALVVLDYALAPGAAYPIQLRQACGLLRYLVETEQRRLADLVFIGDSAGGNLLLALLSHLLHPHPDPTIAPFAPLAEPLAAAVLISPWVSFATDDPSYARNALKDILAPAALRRWGANFLGGAEGDAYNQAVLAPAGWWDGLAGVAGGVFVYGGGREVLIDSIEAVAGVLARAWPEGVRVEVQGDGAHEDMIADAMMGYEGKGVGTVWVEEFVREKLK